MSYQGAISSQVLERAIAEALAESNGTPWDLTPLQDVEAQEASECADYDVYHRDARAVIERLRVLGIISST